MHLRRYSRQYLIDAILFLVFMMAVLCQEYFHFQSPFVTAFAIGFILIYPAKHVLALLNLKMNSIAFLTVLCVGVGIAMIEFLGMWISLAGTVFSYPLFSRGPVLMVLGTAILLFMVLSRDLKLPSIKIDSFNLVSLSVLLVIVSSLGSILMTQYNDNRVNLMFWVLVAFTVVILVAKKGHTTQTKLIMLFALSLSALLNLTLISNFLTGWDIFYEYNIANATMAQGSWNFGLGSNVNSMLSIAVLAPAVSWVGNLDSLWTLKLVFPILFSLVPVCIFLLASRLVDENTGIIGALLFIFIQGFLFEMPGIARQEIAELFLILILLVGFLGVFSDLQKATLGIMFGFGLIASHYATSLIFIFLILLYFIVRMVFRAKERSIFTKRHFLTIVAIEVTWLLYVGSFGVLKSILGVGGGIYDAVVNDMSITSSVVSDRVSSPASLLHTFGKVVFIVIMGLLALGLLTRLIQKRKNIDNYTALAISFGGLLVVSLTLSNFLKSFSDIRMIALLLIVLGVMVAFGLKWVLSLPGLRLLRPQMMYFAAIIIVSAVLINSGFAYSVMNDGPTSIALNDITYPKFSNSEINGAMWVQDNLTKGQYITVDGFQKMVVGGFGWFTIDRDNYDILHVDRGELIFLGERNIKELKYISKDAIDIPISINSLWKNPTVYHSNTTRILFEI